MPQTHEGILVPVQRSTGSWNMQWQLKCPACGIEEVEQAEAGGDHEAVTVHPDRDDYDSPLGTRGGYVSVELSCAAGHGFDFIISNHKGNEFVGVIPRT
ncbi:hypothetical protein SLV14_003233 [Streptomyces sp. Je 1-4]|uniref:hypothetical protein n=1 Tax=Streptomyces TaxID=1883 RepID=UPI0021D99F60|nr:MULTISPECIES: hypothetical protein [unclassified Streptomyces]UYB40587.1 hypothetical protein SLV14_003233 [Streptomyces sp. Je 1-4]UZQ36721.1 hypothetical protein SLV14N_003233 [Streptomyces sp. Je 1-4] [Streptomyces sp. Je 1-4 4N24]UZQ44138.1 hypothetical protein SLV14NA_003233 [Streptomyces sp. Je 1-4] [Streptomyces sp. Je 1-4 4N24_ara]